MQQSEGFEFAKKALLYTLQTIKTFVGKESAFQLEDDLKDVYDTLKRERFEVIVVGEFSNGKSTFINALLQDDLLPSSNVATTTYINKILYSEKMRFETHFVNDKKEEISREQFLQFVSEDKQNVDGVKNIVQKFTSFYSQITHLEIGYPAEICRNDVVLLDSPGTNDMDAMRVKITEQYIPKSDAAIFVLNANKFFTASEKAFLQRILDEDIRKIFFIVNFKDSIKTRSEYEDILKTLHENLPASISNPKVHFVSSLHALHHYKPPIQTGGVRERRRAAKRLSLEDSGMPELEESLFEFLYYENGREKLRKPIERTKRLLTVWKNNQLAVELRALESSIEHIDTLIGNINTTLQKEKSKISRTADQLKRSVDQDIQSIIAWYKKELMNVAELAKKTMNEGISQNKDLELIKNEIDLATGMAEKGLHGELQKKIDRMTEQLFAEQHERLQSSIGSLTSDALQINSERTEWDAPIIMENRTPIRSNDAAVGGAILGGIALFLTGGTLGWGLIGAAGGAVAVSAVSSSGSGQGVEKLQKQVHDRYEKGLSDRAKHVERSLQSGAFNMKELYKEQTQKAIDMERAKANQMLRYQSLSADKKKEKIDELKEKLKHVDSFIIRLDQIFTDFTTR